MKPKYSVDCSEGLKVILHNRSAAPANQVAFYGIAQGLGGDEREAARACNKVKGKSLVADSLTSLHGCPYFIAGSKAILLGQQACY
jgi:hypothetical protein